jgi:Tol biopolymer transport system component
MDGAATDNETRYTNPQFSPDGRYLAVTKNRVSNLVDLTGTDIIDLTAYGTFFRWAASGDRFFTTRGGYECPPIENLEDQDQINFDVLRYSLSQLDNPELISNISGGLKFLTAISSDGQWAGVQNCGCYSECGSVSLWHLPTASIITMPENLYAGHLDFSPDASQVTLSQYQMYGYVQSPLYVALADLYGITPIFEEDNVAPTLALWSPDGQWIAFTAISFAADSMEATDSRVILIRPDGTGMTVVASGFAELVDWSPDSSMLLYKLGSPPSETFYTYDLEDWTQTPLSITIDPYTSMNMDWGRLP